jgi:hypothetical protein
VQTGWFEWTKTALRRWSCRRFYDVAGQLHWKTFTVTTTTWLQKTTAHTTCPTPQLPIMTVKLPGTRFNRHHRQQKNPVRRNTPAAEVTMPMGAAITAVVLVATAMEAVATATVDMAWAAQVNVLIHVGLMAGFVLKITRAWRSQESSHSLT